MITKKQQKRVRTKSIVSQNFWPSGWRPARVCLAWWRCLKSLRPFRLLLNFQSMCSQSMRFLLLSVKISDRTIWSESRQPSSRSFVRFQAKSSILNFQKAWFIEWTSMKTLSTSDCRVWKHSWSSTRKRSPWKFNGALSEVKTALRTQSRLSCTEVTNKKLVRSSMSFGRLAKL